MDQGDVQLPVIAVRPMEGRTGTTLMMQLLATSPEIVFDDRYPSEYRFLSYFRRLAELATEPFDEHRHRGVTAFFFSDDLEFGPVPFRSDVIDTRELRDPLVGAMWGACSTLIRQHHPNVRYYAEKLAVPVDDDLRRAVPLRVIDLVRDPRDVLCSIRGFTASGQGEDGFRRGRRNGHPRLRVPVRRPNQVPTRRDVASPRLRGAPTRALRGHDR